MDLSRSEETKPAASNQKKSAAKRSISTEQVLLLLVLLLLFNMIILLSNPFLIPALQAEPIDFYSHSQFGLYSYVYFIHFYGYSVLRFFLPLFVRYSVI